MKNQIKILCLSSLIAFALPALAIRVVFNGGGYGEMAVVNAYSLLPKILKGYLLEPYISKLSAADVALLKIALNDDSLSKIKVDFFSTDDLKEWVRYPGLNNISIASEALYDAHGKALAVGRLWAIAFQAWAQSPPIKKLREAHGVSRAQVQSFGDRLADQIQGQLNYQTVRVDEFAAQFHSFTYVIGEKSESFLLLEIESGTSNVTPLLIQAISCQEGESHLQEIKSIQGGANVVTGTLIWSCADGRYSGEMMAVLPKEFNLKNSMSQLQFQLHSIRRLSAAGGSCEGRLK